MPPMHHEGQPTPSTPNLPPQPAGYPAVDPSLGIVLGSAEAQAILEQPRPTPEDEARQAKLELLQKAMARASMRQAEGMEAVRAYDQARRGPAPQKYWIEQSTDDGIGSDVYVVPERGYTSVNGRIVPGIDTRLYKPVETSETPAPLPEEVDIVKVMPRGIGPMGLVRNVMQRRLRRTQRGYNDSIQEAAINREAITALTERRKFKPELRPTTRRQGDITRRAINIRLAGREALLEQWRLSSFLGNWEGPDASTGDAVMRSPDGEILRDRRGRRIIINDLGTERQLLRLRAAKGRKGQGTLQAPPESEEDKKQKPPAYRYSRAERNLEERAGKKYQRAAHEIEEARHAIHGAVYKAKAPANAKKLGKQPTQN